MTIKNILVPLDGTGATRPALEITLSIARKVKAHVDVLHVKTDSKSVVPLLGEGMSGNMIEEMIVETSANLGIKRREISDQEIIERCLYPLINEGAKILEEGIAIRSSDIDVVWLYGYGFPRHHGGPMFWADLIGTDTIHGKMVEFETEHGNLMKPAGLLKELAKEGKGFGDI